jgi:hypothetical protein
LGWFIVALASALLFCAPGCDLILPEVNPQPQVHNLFPEWSCVVVAPLFNQNDKPPLDGRRFSLACFAELQAISDFELVPLEVVERAIISGDVDRSRPGEVHRPASILGVGAVVVGSVTEDSPYKPPCCGLRVQWYTANSGFHEIPRDCGLRWATPAAEFISPPLVYGAETALARTPMAT